MFHLGLRCICMRVPGIYLVLLYIFVGLAQDFEYQRRLLSLLFMCMPPSAPTTRTMTRTAGGPACMHIAVCVLR